MGANEASNNVFFDNRGGGGGDSVGNHQIGTWKVRGTTAKVENAHGDDYIFAPLPDDDDEENMGMVSW